MNTIIRNAGKEDFDQIAALFRQLWPGKSQNRERLFTAFQKMAASDGYRLLCAEREGWIVGFASIVQLHNFWQEGTIIYITTMIVDEQHRHRGIGRSLADRITEIARRNGCAKIELESAFHRSEAHAFYEKMGFEKRACFYSKDLEQPRR